MPNLVARFPAMLLIALLSASLIAAQGQPASPAPPSDGNQAVQQMNEEYVKLYRTIMTPKNVADAFGSRIAHRYIAMQITVANRSHDYQWLIQDASVQLGKLFYDLQVKSGKCSENLSLLIQSLQNEPNPNLMVSSADLAVLRGVAEKGQSLDPRNVVIRSLTGAGIIAAGLIGVTDLGHSFAPAVAGFNGPFINAIKEVFPDYTVGQLNRLNDSAYLANTVVAKQQAKVIVIFIPQPYLLTRKQQKQYYKDPESVYGCPDLRLLEANVDGNFIAIVRNP
jgi:hypothetical protein